MIKNFKWLFLVSLTFIHCSKNDDVTTDANSSDGLPLTSGSANFSKYVSLGNSLTSGYSDGALFIEGQKVAYPALLAQQFALIGGGDFTTPFMADNVGGFKVGGMLASGPRLYFNGSAPVPVSGTPSTEILTHLSGPFNNMGVPGAKSFHLLSNSYGNPAGIGTYSNPYFVRFASSPSLVRPEWGLAAQRCSVHGGWSPPVATLEGIKMCPLALHQRFRLWRLLSSKTQQAAQPHGSSACRQVLRCRTSGGSGQNLRDAGLPSC